jgi:hypothetical protein
MEHQPKTEPGDDYELRIKDGGLENDKDSIFRVKNSVLEKSMKKNSEALDEETVGDYVIGNDTIEPNPLQRNEPPNKRIKDAQGALLGMKTHISLV